MLDFIRGMSLASGDFNEKTEFYIDGFLAKNLITLVYADGGSGKSWLGMAMAKHCANSGADVVYLDFDNPLTALKNRGVLEHLVGHKRINYVQRSKVNAAPFDVLMMLEQAAIGKALKGKVFVLDSLRNFADIGMDNKVQRVMEALMNLREAGATVIVLHHSNKDGKNYQGSNHIRNSIDNMYQLSRVETVAGAVGCLLTVKKERSSITDMAFSVSVDGFALQPMDLEQAKMSEGEAEFVNSVVEVLAEQPNLNKTALLDAIGKEKDDKAARALLDKFDGKHWVSSRNGKAFNYCLQQSQLSN